MYIDIDTLVIVILISCAVAGLICLGLYSAMKPVSKQQTAGQYVSQERLVMSINEDNFLRETESRMRIANQAAPGMPVGSAGSAPGQNMTISASANQPVQGMPGQHGMPGQGGGFINLGGQGSGAGAGSGQSGMIHFGGNAGGSNMASSGGQSAGSHGPHVPSHGGTSHHASAKPGSNSTNSGNFINLAGKRNGGGKPKS